MKKLIYFSILFCSIIYLGCEKSSEASANASVGKGGSLAKFTIIGNYVYAVSSHYLYTIDITDPSHPKKVNQSQLSFDMETIYPYKQKLFIGSKTGIYIYSVDNGAAPKLIGEAKHGRSCDPVVANDSVSFSTLKGNTFCGPATSGLYVHDIKDLNAPILKKLIPLNDPVGLGMADSALYVCANSEGLKIYNIKDAYDPNERLTILGAGFIDVIPFDNILICWVKNGINLYDITNQLQPVFIKSIAN